MLKLSVYYLTINHKTPHSGCGHLVVHLRDFRQAHNASGINEMAAKRDRLLILELTGRSCLPDEIDGVKGIEAGDTAGPPQVIWARLGRFAGGRPSCELRCGDMGGRR